MLNKHSYILKFILLKRKGRNENVMQKFCSTCSGRRNTTLPKTMTFPASSSIFANSSPWSRFSHASTQIRKNSLYEIDVAGTSLSFAFTFSTIAALRIFLASSTETPFPTTESPAIGGSGAWVKRSRSPATVALLMPLSFSLSFSPTGRERNSGSLVGEEWYTARRRRNRRKKPLSPAEDSGEARRLAGGGGGAIARSNVAADDGVVLEPSKRRFVKSFRSAIEECVKFFFFFFFLSLYLERDIWKRGGPPAERSEVSKALWDFGGRFLSYKYRSKVWGRFFCLKKYF